MDTPIIKIEVENMRHCIRTALLDWSGQLSAETDKVISDFVEHYDWATEVNRLLEPIVRDALDKAVTEYFTYGEGRAAIDHAIRSALEKRDGAETSTHMGELNQRRTWG